jgi:hypothetical protein
MVGKMVGSFSDLLKQHFKLLSLFRREISKRTFYERCMSAKERDEHSPSSFSQRHGPYATIFAALYAADEPLSIQTIHCDAD